MSTEIPAEATNTTAKSNRTAMLILSYFGLLSLIPYLVEKTDEQIRWHSRQGLILALAAVAVSIVLSILSWIPVVGHAIVLVSVLFSLAIIAVSVLCIVKALKGEKFLIPVLHTYVEKLK